MLLGDIYVHLCTENREKHGPTELSNPKSRVELPNVDWPPPQDGTRWSPASYKWSNTPYKWPYKWLTVLISP